MVLPNTKRHMEKEKKKNSISSSGQTFIGIICDTWNSSSHFGVMKRQAQEQSQYYENVRAER
jgi:hypothetical protein